MQTVARLVSLCGEMSRIQIQLLQRQGSPLLLAQEGIELLRGELADLELSTSPNAATVKLVPQLLRSCATVVRHTPDEEMLAALEAIDLCAAVVAQYCAGGHMGRNYNVNEVCSLLRSINALSDSQSQLMEAAQIPAPSSKPPRTQASAKHSYSPSPTDRSFGQLFVPVYTHAMQLWTLPDENANPSSILSLVEGSSRLHGSSFHFPAINAEKNGLLPAKSKVQMEAKMQRCVGARGLLSSLRSCEMNRIDAGMSLATMAQTGLYDAEVCNRCCDTLFTQHALVSSQQLCQALYHLGTLQHRHVHQKYFSSLIEPRECNAEAVRQHVLGLGMLRQPPASETGLINGVFLHALRAAHGHQRHLRHSFSSSHEENLTQHRDVTQLSSSNRSKNGMSYSIHTGRRQLPSLSPKARRAVLDPLNDDTYVLSPQWYIDVGHGLCCLDIRHAKYKLMTARQTRRSIGWLTTVERCKLLYAIGGMSASEIPSELQAAWSSKVDRSITITAEKLNDMEPHEGPYVMNALRYCGIHTHARIPRAPRLEADENPIDVLLSTWSTVPKERVLELAAQIKPQHLRTSTQRNRRTPTATLTSVVSRVADTVHAVTTEESRRLAPLCAAVEAHSGEMSVSDSMHTLQSLCRLGHTGPQQSEAVRNLLMNLWTRRYDLEGEQLTECSECVANWPEVPEAMQLLEFAASH